MHERVLLVEQIAPQRQIQVDRAESNGYFLSERQEGGTEKN